jgi:hypothetical protein
MAFAVTRAMRWRGGGSTTSRQTSRCHGLGSKGMGRGVPSKGVNVSVRSVAKVFVRGKLLRGAGIERLVRANRHELSTSTAPFPFLRLLTIYYLLLPFVRPFRAAFRDFTPGNDDRETGAVSDDQANASRGRAGKSNREATWPMSTDSQLANWLPKRARRPTGS